MAPRLRSGVSRFEAVPEEALRVILLALPVHARARAACVCRSWRAFLLDVTLWQVLDLTLAGGVAAARVPENLVRGAVARAAGSLRVLSFGDKPMYLHELFEALHESDVAELQQVHAIDTVLDCAHVEGLLGMAPRLQVLNTSAGGYCMEMLPILRNDPPFGPLRVRALQAIFDGEDVQDFEEADVLAFAAAVQAHESLQGLNVLGLGFAPGLNALVDAAAERRVCSFQMGDCLSDAETVPALARLLQRCSLTQLDLFCPDSGFPDNETDMPALCAAIRACPTLTHLKLCLNPPNGANRRTVTELLHAVAALPALSDLDLGGSMARDTTAFGRALGALLRANLPSLRFLCVERCYLGAEGLAPMLDGLAANTHLRELECDDNDPSHPFERNRLKPALNALRERRRADPIDFVAGIAPP
jgi:hypothetical protein